MMCMTPVAAIGVAGWLCYEGVDGWGWFAFLAFCALCGGVKFEDAKGEQ